MTAKTFLGCLLACDDAGLLASLDICYDRGETPIRDFEDTPSKDVSSYARLVFQSLDKDNWVRVQNYLHPIQLNIPRN
jgi:hypothetical protein